VLDIGGTHHFSLHSKTLNNDDIGYDENVSYMCSFKIPWLGYNDTIFIEIETTGTHLIQRRTEPFGFPKEHAYGFYKSISDICKRVNYELFKTNFLEN